MNSIVPQPPTDGWTLHSQLAADCLAVGDLPLSRLLLMNDANYPWLILVPRRAGVREIIDLDEADQTALLKEITRASHWLKHKTQCDKLNVAALGNAVPQLHVHVIARRKDDAAWPKPVWGAIPARSYRPEAAEAFLADIRTGLQIGPIRA